MQTAMLHQHPSSPSATFTLFFIGPSDDSEVVFLWTSCLKLLLTIWATRSPAASDPGSVRLQAGFFHFPV
ncbi:hypothetical protein CHARACLAT_023003 [Characodon lateralis]|uniref:Uncharacterized protein n=1 Tax=Characodon lateralis TaxID=208331 RepID=A0ABU7EC43_9TELE|nr:hypothetical protein [Characodon lateralis]